MENDNFLIKKEKDEKLKNLYIYMYIHVKWWHGNCLISAYWNAPGRNEK